MADQASTPIIVPPTVQVVLVSLATRALAWAGGALVTHGVLTSDQANQSIPWLAQAIVGAAITIGAGMWGAYRAKHKNDQLNTIAALPQVPNSVAVSQPGTPPTVTPPADAATLAQSYKDANNA